MYDIRMLVYLTLSLLFVIFVFYMIVNALVTIRERARIRKGEAQRSIEVTNTNTSEVRLMIGGENRPGKCILHIEERRPEREIETLQFHNQGASVQKRTSDVTKSRGALVYPTGLHLTQGSAIRSPIVEVSAGERVYISSGSITIDPASREALFTLDHTTLPERLPGPWYIRVGFTVKVETDTDVSNSDLFDTFFDSP